jgi:hypothetical protein
MVNTIDGLSTENNGNIEKNVAMVLTGLTSLLSSIMS